MVAYVWDRIVKFFLGNQTTITPDNGGAFLDVSRAIGTAVSLHINSYRKNPVQ
jgi:hypothetical protein